MEQTWKPQGLDHYRRALISTGRAVHGCTETAAPEPAQAADTVRNSRRPPDPHRRVGQRISPSAVLVLAMCLRPALDIPDADQDTGIRSQSGAGAVFDTYNAIREFEQFYNSHRPHQGIANARPLRGLPSPIPDLVAATRLHVRRRDRLGGIIHEYWHAA